MSLYPHFLRTPWHCGDARGAGAVPTGSGNSTLPGSCCPVAEAEALQAVTVSQGYLPREMMEKSLSKHSKLEAVQPRR